MATTSVPPTYFEALYARNPDPWQFASSDYEQAKYAATLQALPEAHYQAGFEIGCSIGVLTRQLAARCERLLAVDVADAALEQARRRCAGQRHVRMEKRRIPLEWPIGRFDLIVLSEVLYYLSPADITKTAQLASAALVPGGTALLVHCLSPGDGPCGEPCGGDVATGIFIDQAGLVPIGGLRRSRYRLDLLRV